MNRTLSILSLSWVLCCTAVAVPSEALTAAARDVVKQPESVRAHLRYLSLEEIEAEHRVLVLQALDFHCNSLSREVEIKKPVMIDPVCVRIDLRDYQWSREVWEKLVEDEPYYHERALQEDGKIVTREASWLPLYQLKTLENYIGSKCPIVRADWFIVYTCTQVDRKVGYYDFLGLGKKEADFQALGGVDVEKARKLKLEMAAVVQYSEVTKNNRSIYRLTTLTGAYWFTQDFKSSKNKQNTLRLLDGDLDPPQGDASEQYVSLPNGLFAFWLQNAAGERQDTAPDFIAGDSHSTTKGNYQVLVGISCARCHTPGIQPIDDWARKTYRGKIKLESPDYDRNKRLRQLYLSNLKGQIKKDQDRYAEVLLRVNGLTPAKNAEVYAKVYEEYHDKPVTLEVVARELRTKPERLVAVLKAYGDVGGDPVMVGLLQPKATMRREHFEEAYSAFQTLLRTIP